MFCLEVRVLARELRMYGRSVALVLWVLLVFGGDLRAAAEKFRLEGTVEAPGGGAFVTARPYVALEAVEKAWLDRKSAGADGRFTFEGLQAGKYMLAVLLPGTGSARKTIVVGASQADETGTIRIRVTLRPDSESMAEVSAVELSIPKAAFKEYEKALDLLSKGDNEKAIRHLEKACDLAPHFASAWNRLGTIAFKSAEFERAETLFRTALEQDPMHYPALVNLGAALLSRGRVREAWMVNLKAVEEGPDQPLAHSQLGATYFEMGQLEQAEKHLKIAKSLDPAHFSNPQLLLAKIYGRRGEYEALIEELKGFLKIHPDYPDRAQMEALIEKAEAGN